MYEGGCFQPVIVIPPAIKLSIFAGALRILFNLLKHPGLSCPGRSITGRHYCPSGLENFPCCILE
jgi:hypothetical protein